MFKDKLDKIKEEAKKELFDRLSSNGNYLIEGDTIKLIGDFYKNQTRISLKTMG